MPDSRSRYRTEGAPDYSHRFHAGNVGDVWKHCVLLEVLRAAASSAEQVAYIDTHAGEGGYSLGPTGEWTEGVGRLWNLLRKKDASVEAEAGADDFAGVAAGAVTRYLECLRALASGDERPTTYPGSPVFARAVLGPRATLTLCERDDTAAARLQASMRDATTNRNVRIVCGDGLSALTETLRDAESQADAVVVLIDPPYTEKADWIAVPDALIRAAAASTKACLLLWYPVKSLTRPNAMIARLEAAATHGSVAELVTTPLTHQRQRLNGSGVILLRPPANALPPIAAAAATIGPLCTTRDGAWSFRAATW